MNIMDVDYDLQSRRLKVESDENWSDHWHLPFFKPKAGWEIQVIPPMLGALVRFKVRKGTAYVSVYFDPFCRLGVSMKPYWEIYPSVDGGDVDRFAHEDFDEMIEAIDQSLNRQIIEEAVAA